MKNLDDSNYKINSSVGEGGIAVDDVWNTILPSMRNGLYNNGTDFIFASPSDDSSDADAMLYLDESNGYIGNIYDTNSQYYRPVVCLPVNGASVID